MASAINRKGLEDLSGQEFSKRLFVIGYAFSKKQRRYWKCLCKCGNYCNIETHKLKSKHTKSCGCLVKEILLQRNIKHGQSPRKMVHPTYISWCLMKSRVLSSNDKNYSRYGGRGISICDEWKNNFEEFFQWSMENNWEPGLVIARKDVDGNYCPKNCQWITRSENSTKGNYEARWKEEYDRIKLRAKRKGPRNTKMRGI